MIKLLFKHLTFLVFFFLSGCSPERVIPDYIEKEGAQIVDAVVAGDVKYFVQRKKDLLPPNQLQFLDDQQFAKELTRVFASGGSRVEVNRHIVGAHVTINTSLDQNPTKTYEIIYEIETEARFLLISLRLGNRHEMDDCCEIKSIDVRDFDTSPVRSGQMVKRKLAIIFGVITISLVLIFTFLIFLKSDKES